MLTSLLAVFQPRLQLQLIIEIEQPFRDKQTFYLDLI